MVKIIPILFALLIFCTSSVFSQEAVKIQEFKDTACEDYLARMDSVLTEAQNNPTAQVYVFVYEGRELKYNNRKNKMEWVFPAFGSAKAKISSIKKRYREFSAERFTFVEAGFRENLTLEIWNVPPGAILPKPSPTLTKMKHRKGKPTGFCTFSV
jgi:hypothetical protein